MSAPEKEIQTEQAAATAVAAMPAVAPVRLVASGFGHTLRTVKVVWYRELLRFGQDRVRIVAFLVQPLLILFVLGTGLSSLTDASTGGGAGERIGVGLEVVVLVISLTS